MKPPWSIPGFSTSSRAAAWSLYVDGCTTCAMAAAASKGDRRGLGWDGGSWLGSYCKIVEHIAPTCSSLKYWLLFWPTYGSILLINEKASSWGIFMLMFCVWLSKHCYWFYFAEHWFGCHATELGFAGDIGAIEIWLIDLLIFKIVWFWILREMCTFCGETKIHLLLWILMGFFHPTILALLSFLRTEFCNLPPNLWKCFMHIDLVVCTSIFKATVPRVNAAAVFCYCINLSRCAFLTWEPFWLQLTRGMSQSSNTSPAGGPFSPSCAGTVPPSPIAPPRQHRSWSAVSNKTTPPQRAAISATNIALPQNLSTMTAAKLPTPPPLPNPSSDQLGLQNLHSNLPTGGAMAYSQVARAGSIGTGRPQSTTKAKNSYNKIMDSLTKMFPSYQEWVGQSLKGWINGGNWVEYFKRQMLQERTKKF